MRGAGLLQPLALALLAAAAAGGRPSPLEQLAATARIKIRDGRPGVREAKALIAKGAASFGDEFLLRQGMREPRRPLFPLVGCGCETAAVHSRRNADHGVRRGRQLRGRQGPHRQVRRGSGVRGPQCALAPALAQSLRTLTPLCVRQRVPTLTQSAKRSGMRSARRASGRCATPTRGSSWSSWPSRHGSAATATWSWGLSSRFAARWSQRNLGADPRTRRRSRRRG